MIQKSGGTKDIYMYTGSQRHKHCHFKIKANPCELYHGQSDTFRLNHDKAKSGMRSGHPTLSR
ncbi:hypothetical protein AG1IA_02301 [Rhizoctonia solani AG-1 IA]|uniref:Uncharacterized protein n=1 Tax=Thanatephorus cucumeris (strain AG1-IA) TaxID=983506 RepID=L8X3R3_THACA|nr:hypothetical protein AG1IA_02301 [Rhizoctonia solani AG-1 IA]